MIFLRNDALETKMLGSEFTSVLCSRVINDLKTPLFPQIFTVLCDERDGRAFKWILCSHKDALGLGDNTHD